MGWDIEDVERELRMSEARVKQLEEALERILQQNDEEQRKFPEDMRVEPSWAKTARRALEGREQ